MPFDMMPQPPADPSPDPRLTMLAILREIAAKSCGSQLDLRSCLYRDIMVDGRLAAWTGGRWQSAHEGLHACMVQERIGIPRLLSAAPIEFKRRWIDRAIAERRAEMKGELCYAA